MNKHKAILAAERNLTLQGFAVYTQKGQAFDLLAIDERAHRFRIKVVSCPHTVAKSDRVSKKLKDNKLPFDTYAVRLRKRCTIIYPSIRLSGEYIETAESKCRDRFYWWEDFRKLKNKGKMRRKQ